MERRRWTVFICELGKDTLVASSAEWMHVRGMIFYKAFGGKNHGPAKVLPRYLPGETNENHKNLVRITRDPADIRKTHLRSTKQERYIQAYPFSRQQGE